MYRYCTKLISPAWDLTLAVVLVPAWLASVHFIPTRMRSGTVYDYLPLIVITGFAVGFTLGAIRSSSSTIRLLAALLLLVLLYIACLTIAVVSGGLAEP